MTASVNLLKKTRVLTEKQYQIERKALIIGVMSFCMIILTLGMTFAWQVIVSAQVKNIDSQIAELTAQNEKLKVANTQQIFIKSRLKLIGDFMSSRAQIREALQRVFALGSEGVTVSSASFTDKNALRIQATADTLANFDTFYNYLEQDNGFFVSIVNKGSSASNEGKYNLDLTLALPVGDTKK
jgi:Tfp pilus assembly protein PilN